MVTAAFATWNERIAPLFDVAQTIHLVQTADGELRHQAQAHVIGEIPNLRAACLAELEIDTLVCGAISKPLHTAVCAYGIEVISFVAGNLQEVIQAWISGKLTEAGTYAMPGCRRRDHQSFKESGKTHKRSGKMKGNNQGNRGAGQGRRGQGRTKQGQGRGQAASTDACVCPQCGHQEPHERGVPCMNKVCAQCGAVMTRP